MFITSVSGLSIRDRPFVAAMVTNLSRVVRWLKMTKINKHGKKLKLLPLLTESIYSFEIFSEHLWVLLILFGANLYFPPCWIVVNLFLRSVSAFSLHGYEVMGSVAQPSSVNVRKTLTVVSNSYRKALINVR